MTVTYIDSQTLGGVVVALEASRPSQWSGWTTQSILTSTCVLMTVPELRISPSARVYRGNLHAYAGTRGNHGAIGSAVASTIHAYQPDRETLASAYETVARWGRKNHIGIAKCFAELKSLDSYAAWIDYESTVGWPTAFTIINGVVDEAFLVPISMSLGVEMKQARQILDRSRDPQIVISWLRSSYIGEDKSLAMQMFSVGALMRGRYHDRVAELSQTNIIMHPMREGLLKKLKYEKANPYENSNSLEYLAKIIIASSMTERLPANRVKLWGENINKVRTRLLNDGDIVVSKDDLNDETALKGAIRIAQACEIQAHPKALNSLIHHSLGLGIGAATSFLLHPWLFPVGFYASEIALKGVEQHLIPASLSRSTPRLSSLAKSIPGRLYRS